MYTYSNTHTWVTVKYLIVVYENMVIDRIIKSVLKMYVLCLQVYQIYNTYIYLGILSRNARNLG